MNLAKIFEKKEELTECLHFRFIQTRYATDMVQAYKI